MVRAIIFDCFGVLITDALQLVLQEVSQYNPEGAAEIHDIIRAANRGLISPDVSRERVATIIGVTTDEYRARISAGEVKDTQLLEYIKGLRPTYKTAILSNISGPSLRRRFTETELNNYFDVVVASGDIGYAKPEPEAYEITAERLGVRCDECIFIDDREIFVEAARATGMQALLYTNFEQFKAEIVGLLEVYPRKKS